MILKFTEQQAHQFIAEQHDKYFEILTNFCKTFGLFIPKRPTFNACDAVYKQCGQYEPLQHHIKYSIPYCVYAGDKYSETVAHEMVHAVIDHIYPNASAHGREFLFMCRAACKLEGTDRELIYHSMQQAEVMKVAEELRQKRGNAGNDISFTALRYGLSDKMNRLQRRQNND